MIFCKLFDLAMEVIGSLKMSLDSYYVIKDYIFSIIFPTSNAL